MEIGYPFSLYDTDQDWAMGDFELPDAIDEWAKGDLGDFELELLDLIDLWAAGYKSNFLKKISWSPSTIKITLKG